METNELLEPFARMLESVSTPAAVRAIEAGGSIDALWNEIAQSGFLDALVDEAAGGAGLTLADVCPLWQALGRHAVPLPVAETMAARALLAQAGREAPQGPIALATAAPGAETLVVCGMVAEHVLVDGGDSLFLASAASGNRAATGVHGSLTARMRWDTFGGEAIARPLDGLRTIAAVIRAALIAGAAARLLEMTVAYANERVQFGKPIGRQQALQQILAIMGEDAVATRIAAELACSGGLPPSLEAAATAKSIASAAVPRITATAHSVHGAIGISLEYDLQLLTRRLHDWRLADGSEGYWNRLLGQSRLASPDGSIDWVRAKVFA
jgi:acyl-CoA dehydrogenase